MNRPVGVGRTVLLAWALLGAACGQSHPAAAPATPTPSALPVSPIPSSAGASASPAASPSMTALPPSPAPPHSPAPPPSPTPRNGRTTVLGTSAKGRTITAVELGDPAAPRRLVVIGCVHGDETAGIGIARKLEALAPPAGTDVWVIESLNPDGAAAGTRQNANGVDLNRNFPVDWAPLGSRGSQQYSGTSALSEPESRLAYDFLLKLRPTITIWFHQPLGLIDLSGGDAGVEQRYAAMVGLPTRQLTRYPGSATSWENQEFPGSTAFVVELPAGRLADAAAGRHAAAALSLLG